MELNAAFGILFILGVIFILVVWISYPVDPYTLTWAIIVGLIIAIIYAVGVNKNDRTWKAFGFFAWIIFILTALPALYMSTGEPVPPLPVPLPKDKK